MGLLLVLMGLVGGFVLGALAMVAYSAVATIRRQETTDSQSTTDSAGTVWGDSNIYTRRNTSFLITNYLY